MYIFAGFWDMSVGYGVDIKWWIMSGGLIAGFILSEWFVERFGKVIEIIYCENDSRCEINYSLKCYWVFLFFVFVAIF